MTEIPQNKLWFKYVRTSTGETYHTHFHPHLPGCTSRELHAGIPCAIDRLIDNKKYRRKYRAMIQRGELPYLLACAEDVRRRKRAGKVSVAESHYFAASTSKQNWTRTKRDLIRRKLHKDFALLDSGEVTKDATDIRRFRALVKWSDHPDVCSVWTGGVDSNGYGRFKVNGKEVVPHRWWYQQQHGPIPPDIDIDHKCENRACMDHLRALPKSVNRSKRKNPGKVEIQRRAAITYLVKAPPGVLACCMDMCPEDAEWLVMLRDDPSKNAQFCTKHKAKGKTRNPEKYEWVSLNPESRAA